MKALTVMIALVGAVSAAMVLANPVVEEAQKEASALVESQVESPAVVEAQTEAPVPDEAQKKAAAADAKVLAKFDVNYYIGAQAVGKTLRAVRDKSTEVAAGLTVSQLLEQCPSDWKDRSEGAFVDCNSENLRKRLVVCEKTKANYNLNLFCRNCVKIRAAFCARHVDQAVAFQGDQQWLEGLGQFVNKTEVETHFSFDFVGQKTSLEEFLLQ